MERGIELLMQAFPRLSYIMGPRLSLLTVGVEAGLVMNTGSTVKVQRRIMCCYSMKNHNALRKRFFSKSTPYYYIKDGPRNTKTNCINSITEKIVELSHDAYKKDYGISVHRRISMDLVKNRVMGQDMVNPDGEPREKLKDTAVCLYFHVHPSIVCRKKKSGVLIEIPGDKKCFLHKGGDLTMEKSTYVGDFFEPQEITKLVIRNNVEKSESKIKWKIEEIID